MQCRKGLYYSIISQALKTPWQIAGKPNAFTLGFYSFTPGKILTVREKFLRGLC